MREVNAMVADSSRGYVSTGTDPYIDREGRPGYVAWVVFAAVVVLFLGVGPVVLKVATGGDIGDAALGGGLFIALIVGLFGWDIYDGTRQSPDKVRLAIDAAGIYLKGGRQPARKPGRIPWSDVAGVVLATRRATMPSGSYLHVEVRLKKPFRDRRGRPRAEGPSVIASDAQADAIAAAIGRHAPEVHVTRR
jgi:hypothetical protein